MGFLFGGGKKVQATDVQKYSGLQVQTSVYGKSLPIIYGRTRVAGNLIWYGDFTATPQPQQSAGKGGIIGGGGGKGGGGNTGYTYSVSYMMALGEGQITTVQKVWWDKNVGTVSSLGFEMFNGGGGQTPWPYLLAHHPDQAVGYRFTANVAIANQSLGNSAQLPNYNFEVDGRLDASAISSLPDADPSQVVSDFLTNVRYGAGFQSAWIGDLTTYKNWCIANTLLISVAIDAQQTASAFLADLMQNTNAEIVWTDKLRIIPYGDQNVSGNGYTYTAPSAPLFDLDDTFFLPNSGGSSGSDDPVQGVRKRSADNFNVLKLEYMNRDKDYNLATVDAKDQAGIDSFGVRQDKTIQAHMFCLAAAARLSVQLQLQRQAVRNTYSFMLDQRWLILDPMDIVTITDERLGLDRQWVRIMEITEGADNTLTFIAEEYLNGTGNAAIYQTEPLSGAAPDYNSDPGVTNVPVIFEVPLQLLQSPSLEVWLAMSGGANWGGADVYLSSDNETYAYAGRQQGPARTGVLTSILPTYPVTINRTTIDQTNTLAVSLVESNGDLTSVSQTDALAYNTLSYVDGELLSYSNASLTGTNAYNITYLVRGIYDSTIGAHAIGTPFARLDTQIFKIPVDQSRAGQTVYIKLLPFNIYGGGQPSIDSVQPLQYMITGEELLAPLDNPAALAVSFTDNVAQLNWSGITDIRQPIYYEIRQGTTFDNAQIYGRTTQTHYPIAGTGTYWVSALYFTPFGTAVYSSSPPSVAVTLAALVDNSLGSHAEDPAWTGAVSGGAHVDGTVIDLALTSLDLFTAGDLFTVADLFSYSGVTVLTGTYTIPVGHRITSTYITNAKVIVNWLISGVSINDSFLNQSNFLGNPDFLGNQFNASVMAQPQLRVSQDGGSTWSDWQNWAPGVYPGNAWDFRIVIATTDITINAVLSQYSFEVDAPTVNFSGSANTSGSGAVTVSYGQTFNTVPIPQVTIQSSGASGDDVILSAFTASGFNVEVINAGSHVVRGIGWAIASF